MGSPDEKKLFIELLEGEKIEELLLYLQQHGSYSNLRELIIAGEKKYAKTPSKQVKIPFQLLTKITTSYTNPDSATMEFPTNEVIHCMEKILEKVGATAVLEVGAGRGILASLLDPFFQRTGIRFEASDSGEWQQGDKSKSVFPLLKNHRFADYNRKYSPGSSAGSAGLPLFDTVIISWVHTSCEGEFLTMIHTRDDVDNVIVIGEGEGKSCGSDEFFSQMKRLFPYVSRIPALSICRIDYFTGDKERTMEGTRNMCRSEIMLFSKLDKNHLEQTAVVELCGRENLGELPMDCTYAETVQDLRCMNVVNDTQTENMRMMAFMASMFGLS